MTVPFKRLYAQSSKDLILNVTLYLKENYNNDNDDDYDDDINDNNKKIEFISNTSIIYKRLFVLKCVWTNMYICACTKTYWINAILKSRFVELLSIFHFKIT